MRSLVRALISLSVVLGVAAVGCSPGLAAPTTIDLGLLGSQPTWTVGGFQLTFASATSGAGSGCAYSTSSGGSCSSDKIVADVQRGTLVLTIENKTASTALLIGDSSGTISTRDMYLNFTVTYKADPTVLVSSASVLTAGSSSNANAGTAEKIYSSASAYASNPGSPLYPTFTGTAAATSPTLQNFTSGGLNTFYVNKDLSTKTTSGLNIMTVTQRYVSNPEPVSMSLLGAGLVGLALVRRRSIRVR
jgi:hypothetical protein